MLKKILLGGIIMSVTISSAGCGKSNKPAANASAANTSAAAESSQPVKEKAPLKKPEEYGKVIALTFDDGPNTVTTPGVLDKLEKYGVTASFFVIGDNIDDESAEVMKRAYDMGCEINSHSKTHSYMTSMTAEEIKAEMDYTSDKIEEITGEAPKFFRPPYIAVNSEMFESIDLPFISGYGCEDYVDTVGIEERAQRTLDQAKDGGIILLHDAYGNSKTVAALDIIIPELKDQGYEFVTVSELFYAKEIQPSLEDEIVYSYAQQTTMYG